MLKHTALAVPTLTSAQTPSSTPPWDIVQTLDQVPDGPLYWRLEAFETREAAEVAAGPTSYLGEGEGQVWVFTLGPWAETAHGDGFVADIGPLQVPNAAQYELRINYRTTAPGVAIGATTGNGVHSHPGAESIYVLAGEQTVWTPGGQARTEAGQSWVGEAAGTPMIMVNTGNAERRAFTLYVGDAAQPWVLPTTFQ